MSMVANAVFAASVIFLALGIWLMEECPFLIPFRHVLFTKYGSALAGFGVILFLNLVTALYWIGRYLFLKDTGRKLAHLEKQLRSGETISEDLSEQIQEHRK